MYEELIHSLRCCADNGLLCYAYSPCYDCKFRDINMDSCTDALMTKAADAIEKLTAYAQQIEELRKDGYYLQKNKMTIYGGQIVSMPIPEPPKEK